MKKIITLLLSTGILTAAYAQGSKDYNSGYGRYSPNTYGKHNNTFQNRNTYNSYAFHKQSQIEKTNREFKFKVLAIQQNRYMTNRQKRLSIRDAKNERNYKMQILKNNSNRYANSNYRRNQWK